MSILVIENNQITQSIKEDSLWDGKFSKMCKDGHIIKFIIDNLPKNALMAIPVSDGNIKKTYNDNEFKMIDWSYIQYYVDYAKSVNKIFILGLYLKRVLKRRG